MTTLAQSAYLSLRADILRGAFSPGQRLRLEQLKARYGLSFSPLREAMNRLTAERLLIAAPARGFAVAPVSSEELRDTTEIRILLESEALRRSIQRGGDAWEDDLTGALHRLERQSQRLEALGDSAGHADIAALEDRHHDFHSALIAACGSPRLLALFEQFYAETLRYRLPTLAARAAGGGRDVAAEHRQLMQMAVDRRADDAVALLAVHYRRTAEQFDPAALAAIASPAGQDPSCAGEGDPATGR